MRRRHFFATFAAAMLAVTSPAVARDGAYRMLHARALGGTTVVAMAVRRDGRGDDEVQLPNFGWTRCQYNSCLYTARRYYFHYWDDGRPGMHLGSGRLGRLLGLDE